MTTSTVPLDQARHVLGFPNEPEWPYVHSVIGWELETTGQELCMRAGPLLYSATRGPLHFPVWCFEHSCGECGPRRAQLILKRIRSHWENLPVIYICTLEAPASIGPKADQIEVLRKELRRTTGAIDKAGGAYLWLRTFHSGRLRISVFSSVDFSTARPNRKRPPRACDALTQEDALIYLDRVLQHGIEKRDCSRKKWPLDDGEANARRSPSSDYIRLGICGAARAQRVEAMARQLNESRAGNEWPQGAPHPAGMSKLAADQLFRDAAAAVTA